MAFNVNSFRSQGLKYGGARPTLFQCEMSAPAALGLSTIGQRQFAFMCQAASIPESSVGQIEVGFFGRKIKVAGDRTYQNWQVQVMNDEDFAVRGLFEKWSNSLNAAVSNYRNNGIAVENDYKADIRIVQYGKNNKPIRAYKLVGAWPTNVGSIELGWNSTNQIEIFGVVLCYDYWVPDTETGSADLGNLLDVFDGLIPGDSNG